MNYYQGFDYVATPGFGAMGMVLGMILVAYLLLAAYGVASYIFQSVGLYTIAKRRGIRNPWLSWLPIGNMWILGSISDQYQYLVKGRIRNRRKALVWLMAAIVLGAFVTCVSVCASIFSEVIGYTAGEMLFGVSMGVVLVAWLVILIVEITAVVLQYMALYDLYRSCDPGNSVLNLVLSILFGFLLPLFIFVCRKKDLGMPPRKTEAPAEPVEIPVWEAPAEEPAEE